MRYQVIFHQDGYSHVDYETDDYNQAQERRSELQAQMYEAGERNFYYEIKDTKHEMSEEEQLDYCRKHGKAFEADDFEDSILEDDDFNTLCGR